MGFAFCNAIGITPNMTSVLGYTILDQNYVL